jgi:predicted porin
MEILMLTKILAATTTVCLGATSAMAQDFGGSVELEYSKFGEFDVPAKSTIRGSVEYAISTQFAVALNYAGFTPDELPSEASLSNLTLHGIYAINSDVKLGVYIGRDYIRGFGSDAEIDNYGIELAYMSGPVSAQGYIGQLSGEDSATQFGASGSYRFENGFTAIVDFEHVGVDSSSITISTVELGAEYEVVPNGSVYATVGNFSHEYGGEGNDAFFTVGARFDFGPNAGTTFDQPGYFEFPYIPVGS